MLKTLKTSQENLIVFVSEIFQFLAGKAVFSSIDLEQSFLQLPVREQDRPKLAFTWAGRHLMFVGTPFGLIPTSAVLQRTMRRESQTGHGRPVLFWTTSRSARWWRIAISTTWSSMPARVRP